MESIIAISFVVVVTGFFVFLSFGPRRKGGSCCHCGDGSGSCGTTDPDDAHSHSHSHHDSGGHGGGDCGGCHGGH